MRRVILFLVTIVTASAQANSPAEAVIAAFNDLKTVPVADQQYIRYHSIYPIPAKERETFLKVYAFQVNSLSRKARLKKVSDLLVAPDLLRLDIRDFKWNPEVYDRLHTVDPYFHSLVLVSEDKEVIETWPGGIWPDDGKHYPKGAFTFKRKNTVSSKKTLTATAPWLPTKEMVYLVEATQSKAPILRADWFMVQTGIQEKRVAGYFDFLELKSRDDFFKLIGFDAKLIKEREREVASIIQKSGVSEFSRQIYRFGANDFGYWQTRDVFNTSVKEKNAINALNGDFKHDAEEHYGFLSNGLFTYYLSDAQGKQQTFAPPEVGFDNTTTNNGGRIHIFKSCVTCHKEGLRPLKDYSRKVFQGSNRLVSYDKDKFERLQQLYLTPLLRWQTRDTNDFSTTLKELNGLDWTPLKNATEYSKFWQNWAETDVTPDIAARELSGNLTGQQLVEKIKKYATPTSQGGQGQVIPNVLMAFLCETDDKPPKPDPQPILREHFEEVYSDLAKIVRGVPNP